MSKATYRKIIQNLWWATGYNIFAIPLAAGVLVGHRASRRDERGPHVAQRYRLAVNAQLLRRAEL